MLMIYFLNIHIYMHLSYICTLHIYIYIHKYVATLTCFLLQLSHSCGQKLFLHTTFLDLWFLVPGLFGEVLLPTIAGPTLFAVLRELETEHGGGRTVGGSRSRLRKERNLHFKNITMELHVESFVCKNLDPLPFPIFPPFRVITIFRRFEVVSFGPCKKSSKIHSTWPPLQAS